jgi:hypothetical protein
MAKEKQQRRNDENSSFSVHAAGSFTNKLIPVLEQFMVSTAHNKGIAPQWLCALSARF